MVKASNEYFANVCIKSDPTRFNESASLCSTHALLSVFQFFNKEFLVAWISSRIAMTVGADFVPSLLFITPLLRLYFHTLKNPLLQ